MPTYEYACRACDHEFERDQRISDKPVKKCPSCGKMQARRLISRTSFVLKGGGWYNDLYASPGADKKKDANAEAGTEKSEPKSDTKDSPKSDKKPTKKKGNGKAAA